MVIGGRQAVVSGCLVVACGHLAFGNGRLVVTGSRILVFGEDEVGKVCSACPVHLGALTSSLFSVPWQPEIPPSFVNQLCHWFFMLLK